MKAGISSDGAAIARVDVVRIAALLFLFPLCGCGPPPVVYARTAPPPGTTPVIAELRARFRLHWAELVVDPSPAAARTRATAVAQAIAGDAELYAALTEREPIAHVVARAVKDAERASVAFPDAVDVWTMLARLRARAGDKLGASAAACSASDVDPKSDATVLLCLESLLDAGDKPGAKARASKALGALEPSRRDRVRAAIKARDADVGASIACEPVDITLGWDELVSCGDVIARTGDRAAARARYHAAFLVAPDRTTQFTSLLRIEELGYGCTDELMMLPIDRAAQYPVWRSMTGAPRRRLERDRAK